MDKRNLADLHENLIAANAAAATARAAWDAGAADFHAAMLVALEAGATELASVFRQLFREADDVGADEAPRSLPPEDTFGLSWNGIWFGED